MHQARDGGRDHIYTNFFHHHIMQPIYIHTRTIELLNIQ